MLQVRKHFNFSDLQIKTLTLKHTHTHTTVAAIKREKNSKLQKLLLSLPVDGAQLRVYL